MFLVGLFIVPPAEFYFFSSDSLNCAASLIVRVRYYTNQIVLNTLWNSYVNKATKNVYRYLYFPNFPIPKEIPLMKTFKTKKKSRYHLGNFNSPLPLQTPPGPGLGSDIIVCVVLFGCAWLLVVVRHFSPFLCLFWFLSVWKYPIALCNCIAICCIRPV